jgi:serine/threonine protein kinase
MEPLSVEALQQEGFIQSPIELQGELGQRFEFLSKLGEGSFGMVAAARDKQTGKMVAIKKIKMTKKHDGIPASALREIGILKHLNHPNIVRYH